MTNSFIVIQGNYLGRMEEIFESFRYNDLNQDMHFGDWANFSAYLFDNYLKLTKREISLRGIWVDNDWTIICDPELVDITEKNALKDLSQKLNCIVLTFLFQSTSSLFGFSIFNHTKKRHFLSTNGIVSVNYGLPVPEELGLNINNKVFEEDILKLACNLGIDLTGKHIKTFTAKKLGYNDEMKKELEPFKKADISKLIIKNKPWWKIW